MRRLCAHTQQYRSARWVAFSTGERIRSEGFRLEATGPSPGHYDVILGATLEEASLRKLEELWSEDPRRRFPECTV